MRITYFHRKVIQNFHFSVEIIFGDVRRFLPGDVAYDIVTSRFYSEGLFKRMYNGIEAFFRRGSINHVTGDINYLGLFLPRKNTIQTILDCVYMQQVHSKLKKEIYRIFWIKIPVRRSKWVTTISQASKDEIVRFSGCDPDKIKVIPIALSPIFHLTTRVYHWDKPRILLVGAAPNKNLGNILSALKDLNCVVQLVGKFNSEYKEYLERNFAHYTYEWGLNAEQMHQKYLNSDILVFASTYEGFGMPIIEAQACGVAVVTSNISSMPEVGGKESAVYVDPYDVLSIRSGVLKLLQEVSFQEQVIARGFENVKRFDPVTVSSMYLELYRTI